VKNLAVLSIPVLLCLLSVPALTQRPTYPKVPPPLDTDTHNLPQTPNFPRHLDLLQMQKEADDLARTAQTIPTDVASVRKGMLPKDIVQKLKKIEKLSKHLRSELNR